MVEAKCPYWKKQVHFEVPLYYYMQMNLCLECTGREWCDYISWTPEAYKIIRVTRDRTLHELMLPHYSNFFAAMSRGAEAPPTLSKRELQEIRAHVEASMHSHVDADYWVYVNLDARLPTPEDSDEPEAKCARLSDACTRDVLDSLLVEAES